MLNQPLLTGQFPTNQLLVSFGSAADWSVSIRGRLLCGISDWSASLKPSGVIWYCNMVSTWHGDLKMVARRRDPSHCKRSLIVGAWPQHSPRAGTMCDWPSRIRVVIWLVITTAMLWFIAMVISCWPTPLRRCVLCESSSKSRRKGNATLSITRRRIFGCWDRKWGSRWSSASSST